MQAIAQQLKDQVATVEPQLKRMNADALRNKPDSQNWSKSEILGHLIDSAANNHQRFVRAMSDSAVLFPAYDQEAWVSVQRHNVQPWHSLVDLWSAYNKHLAHVIESIPEATQGVACTIGTDRPVPLAFLVEDYLRHLKHHLKDLLGDIL